MNKAVFLDRDDTIIVDVPYNGEPAKVKLVPRAAEALSLLKDAGFLLIIISNQSGVGRGYITPEQVDAVNQEMIRQLGENFFAGIYSCFDDPNQPPCECRKPSPALLHQAAREHQINLQKSFMVGDKQSDVEAGNRAGCCSVLIETSSKPNEINNPNQHAKFTVSSLYDAAKTILDSRGESDSQF